MKTKLFLLFLSFSLVPFSPSRASGAKKPHFAEKGTLVEMQAVPCGAQERGITGIGAVVASAGLERVNSKEKLCQEYLLRTDDMQYRIRPIDDKHPVLQPVGEKAEFSLKKDRMVLSMPEGDGKARQFRVVQMKPLASEDADSRNAGR